MMIKKYQPSLFSWALVAALTLFAVGPALTTAVEEYAIDMASFHVYRGILFADAFDISTGLLPRWSPAVNGGLGGPIFSYSPPLIFLMMHGLHSIGFSYPEGLRVIVVLLLMAGSLGMFGLALDLIRRADAALVAAVCFTYAPPLLRDVYQRGSPQAITIALYPWLFWAIVRFVKRPSGLRFALIALCWTLMIVAHNAAAVIVVPLLGVFLLYVLARSWQEGGARSGIKKLAGVMLALAVGSCAAAFYAFPVLFEIDDIQMDNTKQVDYAIPADNPTPLSDLLSLPAVFDTGIENNTMSESVGIPQIAALLILPGLAAILYQKGRRPEAILLSGAFAVGLLVIWLQTDSASSVWRAIPALDIFQYRFRLLALVGSAAALAVAYALAMLRVERGAILRGGIVIMLLVVLIGPQLPSLYVDLMPRQKDFSPPPTPADVQQRTIREGLATLGSFNEFLPIWRHLPFTMEEYQRASDSPIVQMPEGAELIEVKRSSRSWTVSLNTPSSFTAAFYLLYYPGWVARIDGERQSIRPASDQTGYLLLDIPAGRHTIKLDYEGTQAQHAGDWLSLISVGLLVVLCVAWRSHAPTSDEPTPVYLTPRWIVLGAVVALVGLKLLWLDPDTAYLRRTSSCGAIEGADQQVQVVFGGEFHLCGYALSSRDVEPGDSIDVTLYWQVDETPAVQISSFVHVLGTAFNPATNNPLWGQQDKLMPGEFWTTQWIPSMLYRDRYEVELPAHIPAGTYWVEVGMYGADGVRLVPGDTHLPVSDLDSLLLIQITVQ